MRQVFVFVLLVGIGFNGRNRVHGFSAIRRKGNATHLFDFGQVGDEDFAVLGKNLEGEKQQEKQRRKYVSVH